MRGKEYLPAISLDTCRITPAYAGKSQRGIRANCRKRDHPRLCGEKKISWIPFVYNRGSPPPMRGKADDISNYYLKLRITPAYAGKSVLIACVCSLWEDHPRLCGEKKFGHWVKLWKRGSPPPMRGKVGRKNKSDRMFGITPAYAGKRKRSRLDRLPEQDHPRLCGEKPKRISLIFLKSGSPPPMRGKESCAIFKPSH